MVFLLTDSYSNMLRSIGRVYERILTYRSEQPRWEDPRNSWALGITATLDSVRTLFIIMSPSLSIWDSLLLTECRVSFFTWQKTWLPVVVKRDWAQGQHQKPWRWTQFESSAQPGTRNKYIQQLLSKHNWQVVQSVPKRKGIHIPENVTRRRHPYKTMGIFSRL